MLKWKTLLKRLKVNIEDSSLLLKEFSETIQKETKQPKKKDFLVCYQVH